MKRTLAKLSAFLIAVMVLTTAMPMQAHAAGLEPPMNVHAEAKDDKIHISWNLVNPNFTDGYIIYRSTDPNPNTLEELDYVSKTTCEYTDYSVEPGQTYYYYLQSHYGEELSDLSNKASARIDITLGPIKEITVDRIQNKELKVTWTESSNAESYKLYCSTDPDNYYTLIGETYDLEFVHSNLDPDTTYYYKVYPIIGDKVGTPAGPADGTTLHDTYQITASAHPDGSISPKGIVEVREGSSQAFTFTPNQGFEIDKVYINDEETSIVGDTYQFSNVQENKKIHVTFKPIEKAEESQYVIQASAGENGSITPEGNISVTEGGSQAFTFKPDEGFVVDKVLVDGNEVDAKDGTYEFDNVQTDRTIHVTFKEETPTGNDQDNKNDKDDQGNDKGDQDGDTGSGNKNQPEKENGKDTKAAEKANPEQAVATGDDNTILWLAMVGLIAAAVVAAVLITNRKKIKL